MAFTGPLAVQKRRVRPRMTGFEQPRDDDTREGPDSSQQSAEDGGLGSAGHGKAKL